MLGDRDERFRNNVFQGFQRVKLDMEALNIRLMLSESENRRLRETLENRQNNENHQKQSDSQPSLSLSDLRLMIQEIVSEVVRTEFTKAASVFSTETETETKVETPRPQQFTSKEEIAPEETTLIRQTKEKDPLRDDLMRSFERNRKAIIKQQILGEAGKGDYTKIELRDIVVLKKNYCSKASFYRYLDELELERRLALQRKGKRMVVKAVFEEDLKA